MAKKEKTSFFGKIMGGNVTDEAPQMVAVSQIEDDSDQAEELTQDDEVVEERIDECRNFEKL